MSTINFSGSAADMLKMYGAAVPAQKPQTSLQASIAAKRKMETECSGPGCTDRGCTDPNCMMDRKKPQCGEPGCCAENPATDVTPEHDVAPEVEDEQHPIAAKLRAELQASYASVADESDGCGAKLRLTVVSPVFEGKTILAQHRLVNAAAKDALAGVHAFNVKTYTPAKWAARSEK
mmetsp:Transcript_13626/g.41162  ORF Transcript_13626/g.41162 Transcript_13626/m.41162 type:complete len:177 (-) Transcript_13626:750-1280(-)